MTKHIDIDALANVLPHYNLTLNNCKVSLLGNGLINQTYLVRSTNETFVLQKINKHVFKQPSVVVNNAQLICQHLASKHQQKKYPLIPLTQHNTINKTAEVKVNNEHWRALTFIPNCYTVDALTSSQQAELVSSAFAEFTCAMNDFSAEKLNPIITDFHNLSARVEQLKSAVTADKVNRANHCQQVIEQFLTQHNFIDEVVNITAKLPLHVTHNDTKISNLLFSTQTDMPIAVIDLDTCMPGYLMHDFGDMVRTCCSNLAEDGKNIEKMHIRWDILTALAKGYITGFKNNLSMDEVTSLIIGAKLLPFMIGMRFLTDYLDGDNYFHTNFAGHNLVRAKNQFQLYSLLQNEHVQLSKIIHDINQDVNQQQQYLTAQSF